MFSTKQWFSRSLDLFRKIAGDNNVTLLLFSVAVVVSLSLISPTTGTVRLFGFTVPPLCAFRQITGFDCPGCGLTRSLIFAFHGQLYPSYLLHLWGIPTALVLLLQVPYRLYLLIARAPRVFSLPAPVRPWVNRFIFLSLLIPWAVKTVFVLSVRLGARM